MNVGSASLSSPFLRLWCLVFQPRILLFIDNSFRVYYLWCLLVVCNVWFLISAGDLGCSSFFHPHTMWIEYCCRCLKMEIASRVFHYTHSRVSRCATRDHLVEVWKILRSFLALLKNRWQLKKFFIEKNLSLFLYMYIFPASPHPACNYWRGDSGVGVVFPFSFSNHLLLILEKQRNWCRVLEGRERVKDPSILI